MFHEELSDKTLNTLPYTCNKYYYVHPLKCYGSENTNSLEFKQVKGNNSSILQDIVIYDSRWTDLLKLRQYKKQ